MATYRETPRRISREVVREAIEVADRAGCQGVADFLRWSESAGSWVLPDDKTLDAEFTIVKEPKALPDAKT